MNTSYIKKIFVIVFFTTIGLFADQVDIAAVWGAKGQIFTLLQLFAPAVGAFLGGIAGVVAVLLTEVASFIIQGKELTMMNVFRLLPLLCATAYFASIMHPRVKFSRVIEIVIPTLAMIVFWAHPEGRKAWYYALYWTIPMIVSLTSIRKTMVGRSFGSTFTAHAVGGAYWIWATNMAAPLWTALIPIVALERTVFGLGIALTYLIANAVLAHIPASRSFPVHVQRTWSIGAVK